MAKGWKVRMKNGSLPFFLTFLLLSSFTMALSGPAQPEVLVLDVARSVELALANHPSLLRAEARIQEAKGKTEEARSTKRPAVALDASSTRTEPVSQLEVSSPLGTQRFKLGEESTYAIRVGLRQLISSFGRAENGILARELAELAAREDSERQKAEIAWLARRDFYSLLKARELALIGSELIGNSEAHLKTAKDRFEAGTVARYDIIRAEVELARAKRNLIILKNAEELARAAFLNTLVLSLDTRFELRPPPPAPPLHPVPSSSPTEALSNRPEIKAARFELEMAQKLLASAKSGSNPQLSILGNYNWRTVTTFTQSPTWDATVALSVPLYDGRLTRARVEQAEAVLSQLNASFSELEKGVTLEVKQAALTLKEAEERLKTTEKEVEQAQEAGLGASLELSDAELSVNMAKTNRINAMYDYQVALAGILRAIGKTND
ncbi:MAG: TolC family protein [Armatimonadetes bacterium]|nr:TolC family protein [Armatimonadota bacterium]